MIDFAVVGAGAISQGAYLPALQSLSTARARWVVDVDADRASSLADEFDAEGHATDDRDVIDRCDAVIIAVPPAHHADIAERYLRHDVHVFTEKPVATNADRGSDLVALAEERGVHYGISRQLREAPTCRAVRAFCNNGAIGRPETVRIRYGDETHWDFASDYRLREDLAGGGVFTDRGPHVLDLLLWIFGEDVAVRRYRDDTLGGLEANAIAELELGDEDVSVRVEVTADRDITNEVVVDGTSGHLEADPHGTELHMHDASGEGMVLEPSGDETHTRFLPRVATQLRRFVEALNGGPREYVPAADGVRVVEWIESCYAIREELTYAWEPTFEPLAVVGGRR